MASSAVASSSGSTSQLPATIQTQTVLHLRGATREEERQEEVNPRRIQWAEDVVDNEGLGRKKSKVCCIYHAPKEFGESSDESSSGSSSDSDSGDGGAARPAGGRRGGRGHGHDHHDHSHGEKDGNAKGRKGKGRARSPNAYEKMPKPKGSGSGSGSGDAAKAT